MLKVDVLKEIAKIRRNTDDGGFHSFYETLCPHLIYKAATGYLRTTVDITCHSEKDIQNVWLTLTGLGYQVEYSEADAQGRIRSMTISWE